MQFIYPVTVDTDGFTRASTATYFDADGVLQTAAANVPRFQFDPETGDYEGVLLESAATNYVNNSSGAGAAAGSPGTIPTSWATDYHAGSVTRTRWFSR